MTQKKSAPALNRRTVFAGAGAVGAMAAAAAMLPRAQTAATVAAAPKAKIDPDGGYQVTPHVLQYYQTTKV